MDIQFLGENSMVLNRYITTYITKAEKNSTQAVWNDLNRTTTLQGALKSYALLSFKNREVGAIEVAHKLLGYSSCEASCKIEWLNTSMKNDRNRRLKEKKDIELLEPDSTSIYHNNILDNYYPNRPTALENMCLYDFASNYEYKKTQCNMQLDTHENCIILNNDYGYMHRRSSAQLLKTYRHKPNNNETKEKYFHQILILFKPWRNEDSDLLANASSYEESFRNSINSNQVNTKLFTEFEDQFKKIEEAKEYAARLQEQKDDESDDDNSIEGEEDEQNDLNIEVLPKSEDTVIEQLPDEDELAKNIESLNKKQKEIFQEIIKKIDHLNDHKTNKCKCKDTSPLRIFCSGVGGKYKQLENLEFNILRI
jgi:hypothetical protein